jgi:transcriptional regulator with XRE-family HTH domain
LLAVRTGELRARRKAKGLSVDQVATLCGVSASTVVRWEQGKTKPSRRDHADRLARLLNVTASELLGGREIREGS